MKKIQNNGSVKERLNCTIKNMDISIIQKQYKIIQSLFARIAGHQM